LSTVEAHHSHPLVLVVDDDEAQRMIIRAALEKVEFTVVEAENGSVALEKFEEMRPDLVLLDIKMPVLDGYDTCKALRELPHGTHTPVVVVTSLDDMESVKRAYDVGATDFISKPINYLVVTHRLRYVLRANRYLAYYDDLTGLPNRTLLLEQLKHAVSSGSRHQRSIAILSLGLDQFKRFNETLGHQAGDELLRRVARRLCASVRSDDYLSRGPYEHNLLLPMLQGDNVVAHSDGDEFIFLLTNINRVEDTAIAVRRITDSLSRPFVTDGDEFHITASIGISVFPLDGDDPDDLLKHAEVAMNHAKERGRDCYQFYTESLDLRTRKKFYIETNLRKALDRGEFEVHYQPKVDVQDGKIAGVEALVRWPHPESGMVSPQDFIPVAEETGLIVPLGDWVLRTACMQAMEWHKMGLVNLTVAINLSAAQFKQKRLGWQIEQILSETGLEARFIELELTEGVLMEDSPSSVATLAELREIGLSVAIDDFGTGYSSLSYLRQFPLTTLKIDQSFVRDLVTNDVDGTIVKAIIGLGSTLYLKVVAEGVEHLDQLEFLRKNGCDEVQGLLFSGALPGNELTGWVQRSQPFAAFSRSDPQEQSAVG
jgi:predicted signal transduction protein with EAL and GGDEF domain